MAKVLVVDDEVTLRVLMEQILASEGYEVVTAVDGQEGLLAFLECHPSLVILDLMMPNMNGWQLLERIREISDTPVIILSALGHSSEKVTGLKRGAADYVAKPFRPGEFVARVEATLRRSRQG